MIWKACLVLEEVSAALALLFPNIFRDTIVLSEFVEKMVEQAEETLHGLRVLKLPGFSPAS